MIAFFCTMPMSRTMPIRAISERSLPVSINASNAPTPGRGQAGENRDRVDIALIKHAQDDVDDDDGGQDEKRLALERGAELGGAAGEGGHHGFRQADFLLGPLDGLDGLAQRSARTQVEGEGDGRELALVNDGQRRGLVFRLAKALSGTSWPVADLT